MFKCQKRRKIEGKRRRGGSGGGREVGRDGTPGHAGCVLALAVSSDGKFLVSFLKITVSVKTRTPLHHHFTTHLELPCSLFPRVHLSSQLLRTSNIEFCIVLQASGGKDGVIHVWNPETNAHIHKFTGHRDTVSVSIQWNLRIMDTLARSILFTVQRLPLLRRYKCMGFRQGANSVSIVWRLLFGVSISPNRAMWVCICYSGIS